jgi:hypothetical protein
MTYVTHDSGERAEFDSGMVRDTNGGKPRFDLITPVDLPYEEQMLTRWASLMARGAEKYGDRNWEKAEGIEEMERFLESAFRHFMEWYHDVQDGEDHAAAAFFNISAAEYVWSRMNREPEPKPNKTINAQRREAGLPEAPHKIEIIDLDPKRIEPEAIIKFASPISQDTAAAIAQALKIYRHRGGRW